MHTLDLCTCMQNAPICTKCDGRTCSHCSYLGTVPLPCLVCKNKRHFISLVEVEPRNVDLRHRQIAHDVQDIYQAHMELKTIVLAQDAPLQNLTDNCTAAKESTDHAQEELRQARKLAYLFPIGAVIGGIGTGSIAVYLGIKGSVLIGTCFIGAIVGHVITDDKTLD